MAPPHSPPRKAQEGGRVMSMRLRQHARICIPGVAFGRAAGAIRRAVAEVLCLRALDGPEMAKTLERHVARLHGISSPSRLQLWQLGAMNWLLEAPETEPESIEDLPRPLSAATTAALAGLGPRRGTQMLPLAGSEIAAAVRPSLQSTPQQTTGDDQDQSVRGAH